MSEEKRGKPLLNKLEPERRIVHSFKNNKGIRREVTHWSKTGRNIIKELFDFILS